MSIILGNVYRIAIVVYLECSVLWLYSAYLGRNRPTAPNSFVEGPMPMDLEYPDSHHESQHVSIHYVHR